MGPIKLKYYCFRAWDIGNSNPASSAYSAIANDGIFVAPRLVSHIVDPSGNMERLASTPSREVISASTAHQVADLLTSVVDNGTGEKASVNGYKIAAKQEHPGSTLHLKIVMKCPTVNVIHI